MREEVRGFELLGDVVLFSPLFFFYNDDMRDLAS